MHPVELPALSASGVVSLAAAVEAGTELSAILGEESLALLHLHALAVVTDVHDEHPLLLCVLGLFRPHHFLATIADLVLINIEISSSDGGGTFAVEDILKDGARNLRVRDEPVDVPDGIAALVLAEGGGGGAGADFSPVSPPPGLLTSWLLDFSPVSPPPSPPSPAVIPPPWPLVLRTAQLLLLLSTEATPVSRVLSADANRISEVCRRRG